MKLSWSRIGLSFAAFIFLLNPVWAEEELELPEITKPKPTPIATLYRVSITQQPPNQNTISTRHFPVFQISLKAGGAAWAYWNETENQIASVIAGPRFEGVSYKTEQKQQGFSLELDKKENGIELTIDWTNKIDQQKQMQTKTTIPVQLNQWIPILQTIESSTINRKTNNIHNSTRSLSKDYQSIFVKVETINQKYENANQ